MKRALDPPERAVSSYVRGARFVATASLGALLTLGTTHQHFVTCRNKTAVAAGSEHVSV